MAGYGNTPRDAGNLPMGSIWTPGQANPIPLQGGAPYTDVNGNISAPGIMAPGDSAFPTYSACIVGQVPATTAGDCFVLNWVSKVIRLRRIQVTGTATTATTIDVTLVRRSTADSAGTSTTPTIVPHDSANPAATATVRAYTVAPTAGTLVGVICAEKLLLAVSAATGGESQVEWIFGERPSQCPILRAAGLFAVTISAVPSGGSMTISMEWSEDNL
jgi:hypothetical protein